MAEIPLERLLVLIASGDRSAVGTLYDRIGDRLHALMRSTIGHARGADDCLLETFVDIWRLASRFDAAAEPAARWITRVASEHIARVRSTTIADTVEHRPGSDDSTLGATA